MPVEVIYLDDGHGVIFRGTGVVTGQEILAANKELFSTPEKTAKYKYGLADWTGIEEYNVTSSDLEKAALLSKNASKYLPELFLAVVADKDMPYGMSRMFEAFLNDLKWDVMLFREMVKAEAWIKEMVRKKHGLDLKVNEPVCFTS